jgi:hypothetical protein
MRKILNRWKTSRKFLDKRFAGVVLRSMLQAARLVDARQLMFLARFRMAGDGGDATRQRAEKNLCRC